MVHICLYTRLCEKLANRMAGGKRESLSNVSRLKSIVVLDQNSFHNIDNAIEGAKNIDLVGEGQKIEKTCDLFGARFGGGRVVYPGGGVTLLVYIH